MNATRRFSGGLLRASAIVLFLFVSSAVGSAVRKPISLGFDEVAHVSYVAYLQKSRVFWPELEQMRMIDPVTFQFTSTANYLNHPPFFYWLAASLGPEIEGRPGSLLVLRLMNLLIVAIGLAGLLALAARMKLSGLPFYAFVVMTAATPVLAPLAGSVNNDNLAFAGGVYTILGAYMYVESRTRTGLGIACAGMVVASASKLTGLLLSGGFLLALCLLLMWKRTISRTDVAIVILSLAVAAAPYLAFILQYGSPVPNTPAQIDLLREGANAAGWSTGPRLGLAAYSMMFLTEFIAQWMPSLQQRNDLQIAMLALPVAMLAVAVAGAFHCFRAIGSDGDEVAGPIIAAGMSAIVATFAIHVAFSYQRHIDTGWMMDAYPRYYLPLLAIIPMAALAFTRTIGSARARAALLSALILAPLVFRLLAAPLGS